MKNHHVAASRRAAKSRRRLKQVRQLERQQTTDMWFVDGLAQDALGSMLIPEHQPRPTYATRSITKEDQTVLDAADEWYYDLLRRPTSRALRLLYDAVTARIPESKRTTL